MIEMARDYVGIAAGTTQATSSRATGVARAGLGRMRVIGGPVPAVGDGIAEHGRDLRQTAERSKAVIAALLASELDRLIGCLGLVPVSELHALRQRVQRIERGLDEVREDRE